MNLTADSYYSVEADKAYWSASAVKSMIECQAAGLAELNGEWTRPDSDALLIGSYVDAAIEGSLGRFIQYHPQLFKRDGTLKSQFAKADEMARRAMSDPVFCEYLRGEKQKIVTGDLFGYPFKAKYDVYLPVSESSMSRRSKTSRRSINPDRGGSTSRRHGIGRFRWLFIRH